jgi:alanine racemase
MVIKANAYGHGIEDLLPMIEACGVDHFSVFSVEAEVSHQNPSKHLTYN